jgi:two-component system chemotaxis response regulator CheY
MIRLIVADDAPFIREIVRFVAEKGGFEIVGEAQDGQEAVDLAMTLRPDVILMDIIMPNKSGIEATKEILEKLPDTRIIACSTVDQDLMIMRALEAGCCSYLTKPFKGDELLNVLKKSLS